jgi:hypothetical protein
MDVNLAAAPSPTVRKTSAAILGMAIMVSLQLIVSVALYGARATANGDGHWVSSTLKTILNNDLLVLWSPSIVSAIIMGAILSLALRLNKPAACFVAVVVSGVTWIVSLTVAINKFGA